ncbi:MAG: hypothetical protein WBV45_11600 [Lutimonas sp.]
MKNLFKFTLLLFGFMGFSQSVKQNEKSNTVTFPNGDESIVITTGKQANLLKLTSDNQTDRFEALQLSNHEAVHQRELPGIDPGLESLTQRYSQHGLSREEEIIQEEPEEGSEA